MLEEVLATLLVSLAGAPPPRPVAQAGDEPVRVGREGVAIVEWARRAESLGFSGAVLAAKDGEVIAAVGVGSADLEGEVPNTPATLFEIASATKQFTGAAAVCLAREGLLDLDDSINPHLPKVPRDCRGITVRHLLQHTSGIPGTNSSGQGDQLERVIKPFLRGGPVHPPGTHFEYWNQGYRDSTGTDFIVSAEGPATTVRIEWSSGPVTHTFMGVTDDGELVLYEWSEVTPVRLDRRPGKQARGLELFDREFERK